MRALLTFLEGLLSFISPCMLPLLPLYITYFAGGADQRRKTFANGLAFVAGFTVVFSLMGFFSGSIGSLFVLHERILNLVCGAVVILFGLSYLELIKISVFKGGRSPFKPDNPVKAFAFGLIYSVSLTPCVGAFLGSALMLAGTSGSSLMGFGLLLCYSLGLGIPFLVAAALIDYLAKAFEAIKSHYRIINTVCGVFLIATGIVMMCGLLNPLGSSRDMTVNGRTVAESVDSAEAEDTEVTPERTEDKEGIKKETVLDAAPDFVMKNQTGEEEYLSDHFAKPVILHFWATWCPPCKEELPIVEAMYDQWGEDIDFLIVDLTDGTRETKESAFSFVVENDYHFPIYMDTTGAGVHAYGVMAIPTTVCITKSGNIYYQRSGSLTEEDWNDLIERFLASAENTEN